MGGRFDIADQTYEDRRAPNNSFERTDEAFSPRAGIVYKPAENISFYGSYTRSFKPVIGQEVFLDPVTSERIEGDPFEPEIGTQYEIGVKADITDQLSATLALYDLTRTNVLTEDPNDPIFSIQSGKQRSHGVELDVAGEILPDWNITAGYAYNDASVVEEDRKSVV